MLKRQAVVGAGQIYKQKVGRTALERAQKRVHAVRPAFHIRANHRVTGPAQAAYKRGGRAVRFASGVCFDCGSNDK